MPPDTKNAARKPDARKILYKIPFYVKEFFYVQSVVDLNYL